MEKKRLEKYESLIHSIINEYFILEGKTLIKNNFLTIMGVKASSNMSLIKVYLSFLKENSENENFKIVQQNSKKIRGYLGNKIRHLIRKIPEIKKTQPSEVKKEEEPTESPLELKEEAKNTTEENK